MVDCGYCTEGGCCPCCHKETKEATKEGGTCRDCGRKEEICLYCEKCDDCFWALVVKCPQWDE